MTPLSYIILLMVAAVATILLVPPVKWLAKLVDAIDYPSGRRVNTEPIPRLGGVAMFGGMCISIVVMLWGLDMGWWTTPLGPHPTMQVDYTLTAAGVLIMFLVGLCDDIYLIHKGRIILHEDTDKILSNYGILKMDGETYEKMDRSHILEAKKESYGYRCLSDEKQYYVENYPGIVVENSGIDDLILMLTGGK